MQSNMAFLLNSGCISNPLRKRWVKRQQWRWVSTRFPQGFPWAPRKNCGAAGVPISTKVHYEEGLRRGRDKYGASNGWKGTIMMAFQDGCWSFQWASNHQSEDIENGASNGWLMISKMSYFPTCFFHAIWDDHSNFRIVWDGLNPPVLQKKVSLVKYGLEITLDHSGCICTWTHLDITSQLGHCGSSLVVF